MVKVKLAWVENNKARAIFFRRRSEGVLKKVKELTILCDILACLIIFSPNDAEPMVWPSVETARGLLDNFFSLPKFEQKKRDACLESFLKEKINKVQEKLKKNQEKCKEYVIDQLMIQLQQGCRIDDFNLNEINELLSFSRDRIILGREMLGSMQFSPLRDPPVLPFEVQVEQLAEKRDEATVLIELANNDVRQEPPPNETFAREDHVDLSLLGIDKDWLKLNNYHF
ncbi:hypothetical protein CARUB_v10006793mg [Capsella rubella]|uniref:MADS-box domain-containing protein n=1 Tax=Capsella rubella TaxID=81985 RepID=R0GX57_9BRAS|nr:hypothetical protein CARUB_v10006793mg [Capsella rubella]